MVKAGAAADSLLTCGTLSSYWAALSSPDVMLCARSYCSLYAMYGPCSQEDCSFLRGDGEGLNWERGEVCVCWGETPGGKERETVVGM